MCSKSRRCIWSLRPSSNIANRISLICLKPIELDLILSLWSSRHSKKSQSCCEVEHTPLLKYSTASTLSCSPMLRDFSKRKPSIQPSRFMPMPIDFLKNIWLMSPSSSPNWLSRGSWRPFLPITMNISQKYSDWGMRLSRHVLNMRPLRLCPEG